jgi:hypothetical protein
VPLAVVADVCCPPLLICTHTVETRWWTRLRLLWACAHLVHEGVLCLCLYCCLLRCLDALVVQLRILSTLPCLPVICEWPSTSNRCVGPFNTVHPWSCCAPSIFQVVLEPLCLLCRTDAVPTLPCGPVVCECCLLLGVEVAEVVQLAVVVDLRSPTVPICTHTIEVLCCTGLRLRWACTHLVHEDMLGL